MSISSRSRRLATALTGAALVGSALIAGSGASDAATPATTDTVVGTWAATLVIHEPTGVVTGTSTLTFAPGGKFCLLTSTSTGSGTWVQGGPGIAYRALEKEDDPTLGTIRVNQAGRVQGNSLSSVGVSLIYDASGKQTGAAVGQVTATRTSTTTTGC